MGSGQSLTNPYDISRKHQKLAGRLAQLVSAWLPSNCAPLENSFRSLHRSSFIPCLLLWHRELLLYIYILLPVIRNQPTWSIALNNVSMILLGPSVWWLRWSPLSWWYQRPPPNEYSGMTAPQNVAPMPSTHLLETLFWTRLSHLECQYGFYKVVMTGKLWRDCPLDLLKILLIVSRSLVFIRYEISNFYTLFKNKHLCPLLGALNLQHGKINNELEIFSSFMTLGYPMGRVAGVATGQVYTSLMLCGISFLSIL